MSHNTILEEGLKLEEIYCYMDAITLSFPLATISLQTFYTGTQAAANPQRCRDVLFSNQEQWELARNRERTLFHPETQWLLPTAERSTTQRHNTSSRQISYRWNHNFTTIRTHIFSTGICYEWRIQDSRYHRPAAFL